MGSTKHCKTDFDIWTETLNILNCLPCTSTFSHVKGHQDDALYAFCKVRSPLPRIEMDKLAEQCRTGGSQPMMTTVLQSSKIALVLNSSVVTSNVEETINHAAMKYEPVQTYLCQRNEWTPTTFHLIDWQSFGRYFKSIPMAKRIKVSKYIRELKYPNTFMIGKTPAPKKKSSHVVNIQRTHQKKKSIKHLVDVPCAVDCVRPPNITFTVLRT